LSNKKFSGYKNIVINKVNNIFLRTILILGGRNKNGFKTDRAYLFEILNESDERGSDKSNKQAKISCQVTAADHLERWFLSYSGEIQEGSALPHNTSIYFLRKGLA
jgi:hypothetical protein